MLRFKRGKVAAEGRENVLKGLLDMQEARQSEAQGCAAGGNGRGGAGGGGGGGRDTADRGGEGLDESHWSEH